MADGSASMTHQISCRIKQHGSTDDGKDGSGTDKSCPKPLIRATCSSRFAGHKVKAAAGDKVPWKSCLSNEGQLEAYQTTLTTYWIMWIKEVRT